MAASGKERLARNFSRAAPTYDQHAPCQRLAAGELLRQAERLQAVLAEGPALEIGCGTGQLSGGLARLFPERELLFADLSPAMLEICRARVEEACGPAPYRQWQVLDGEQLPARPQYALIASGFALHWCAQWAKVWQRWVRALRPGGWLLCACQGEGSFPEWEAQCRRLDLPCTANPLPRLESLQQGLAGWPVEAQFWEQEMSLRYADALEFFRSLKRAGVATKLCGTGLTSAQFRRLLGAWDAACPAGIEITVRTCYAMVKRCR
ncbi:MAG: methyltransferase domain-containing protein [Candidatus Latescibacteria bacterium]|nr:methyltransferase domain-containing protein [Candidatus Latescibacterota bacterium]